VCLAASLYHSSYDMSNRIVQAKAIRECQSPVASKWANDCIDPGVKSWDLAALERARCFCKEGVLRLLLHISAPCAQTDRTMQEIFGKTVFVHGSWIYILNVGRRRTALEGFTKAVLPGRLEAEATVGQDGG
jgi:hypothetical protein